MDWETSPFHPGLPPAPDHIYSPTPNLTIGRVLQELLIPGRSATRRSATRHSATTDVQLPRLSATKEFQLPRPSATTN